MRSSALLLPLVAYSSVLRAQNTTQNRPVPTDGSRLAVPGGQIWYRVVGRGSGTPVILLHGGPGNPSVYLKSLEALGDERVVVRYDQLGAGYSDVVHDTALFNIPHFVEELEQLRRHLALDRVHLYGHSWGATLAVEYYRAHPELNDELQREWALLDTHDSLTDWYRHLRSRKAIRAALERSGLTSIWCEKGGNGVEARAMRPRA